MLRQFNLFNRQTLRDAACMQDGETFTQLHDRDQIVRNVKERHAVLTSQLPQ